MMKNTLFVLLLLICSIICAQSSIKEMSQQEHEALTQFIGFCKIQVDVESSAYGSSYSQYFILAFGIENSLVEKSYLKEKLSYVILYEDDRNKFLSFIAKTFNDKEMLKNFILPAENRYVMKVSNEDAEVLTNYIFKVYK